MTTSSPVQDGRVLVPVLTRLVKHARLRCTLLLVLTLIALSLAALALNLITTAQLLDRTVDIGFAVILSLWGPRS